MVDPEKELNTLVAQLQGVDVDTDTNSDAEVEVEIDTDTGAEIVADTGAEIVADTDTEIVADTDTDTDAGVDADAGTGADVGADKYNEAIDELLHNYRSDRQQLSTFIDHLKKKIDADKPGNATRIYYESVTQALKTRSESNVNLIKLIDILGKRSDGGMSGITDQLKDLLEE